MTAEAKVLVTHVRCTIHQHKECRWDGCVPIVEMSRCAVEDLNFVCLLARKQGVTTHHAVKEGDKPGSQGFARGHLLGNLQGCL